MSDDHGALLKSFTQICRGEKITDDLHAAVTFTDFEKAASTFLYNLAKHLGNTPPTSKLAWYISYHPLTTRIPRISSSKPSSDGWELPGPADAKIQQKIVKALREHRGVLTEGFRLDTKLGYQVHENPKRKNIRIYLHDKKVMVDSIESDEAMEFVSWAKGLESSDSVASATTSSATSNDSASIHVYEQYLRGFLEVGVEQCAIVVVGDFDSTPHGVVFGYGNHVHIKNGTNLMQIRVLANGAMHHLRYHEAKLAAKLEQQADHSAWAMHELRNQGFVVTTVARRMREDLRENPHIGGHVLDHLERLEGIGELLSRPSALGSERNPELARFVERAARALWLQHRGFDGITAINFHSDSEPEEGINEVRPELLRAIVETIRNAVRHAEGSRCTLQIGLRPSEVTVASIGASPEAVRAAVVAWSPDGAKDRSHRGIALARASAEHGGWAASAKAIDDSTTLIVTFTRKERV